MHRPFFKSSNKSQASLEKIQDPRDHSPALREQHSSQQAAALARQQQLQLSQQQPKSQQQRPVVEGEASAAYPQSQYTGPPYQHPPSAQQHPQYIIQSSQPGPPQDERYYSEQLPSQAQVLERSTSHRQSLQPLVNASPYREQQQLQAQGGRPTVTLVNPHQQQEDIPEDDLRPGQTQFGRSQRLTTSGPKEEKKPRSNVLRGLFGGGKDKEKHRESQIETSKPGRAGSVLRRGQPNPPQSPAQPDPKDSKFPQSPHQPRSDSIAAYQNQQFQHDSPIDDLTAADDPRQYYRPNSQYEPPSQQEGRRPSVQYHEDAPHFPPPEQTQQYHETGLQQQQPPNPSFYHQTTNVSQSQLDRVSVDDRKGEYLPYSPQNARDRPSAIIEADHTLRPPSQSSLGPAGPPSPLGGPATLATRQPSTAASRYSTQSVQAYQAAQQEANKIQQQQQSQPQSQHNYPSPSQAQQPSLPQVETPPAPTPDKEMPSRGEKDRPQRDSRVDEQDQRYQVQDPRLRMSTAQHDTGRNTPPPRGREDVQQMDHQTLLQKYEELQGKYSKVKRYYFDREAQITQLQNTVANQRLSMSKTSLDDAQYVTRFERLNGAIQNLSFNIRKDWRRLPNWLAPACNKEACATGTKEMTAVGRAVISRWLFDSIFQTIFHPGIDQTLSQHLKYMEQTLRRTPASVLTDEQRDDLLTKVTTWRLTTCEGLADMLNSRQSEAYTESLSRELSDQLCDYLRTLLNDPPPPNLDGYLLPIISQALSISANLPQESRDICIAYYSPGMMIDETYMKLESGMTPLEDPGSAPTREDYDEEGEDERKSVTSDADTVNVEEQIKEQTLRASANNSVNTVNTTSSKDSSKRSKGSGWFNGNLVNKKQPVPQPQSQKADVDKGQSGVKQEEHAWTLDAMTRGQKQGKIRFAVFLAVEIRGKSPRSADTSQTNSAGNGNNDNKSTQIPGNGASAGLGVSGNAGGTSGNVGTGGNNVLYKAPVFGF